MLCSVKGFASSQERPIVSDRNAYAPILLWFIKEQINVFFSSSHL